MLCCSVPPIDQCHGTPAVPTRAVVIIQIGCIVVGSSAIRKLDLPGRPGHAQCPRSPSFGSLTVK